MKTVWYCTDCETQIERESIADHETDGHNVRGIMRPDRLLGNDPWNVELTDDSTDEQEVTD